MLSECPFHVPCGVRALLIDRGVECLIVIWGSSVTRLPGFSYGAPKPKTIKYIHMPCTDTHCIRIVI